MVYIRNRILFSYKKSSFMKIVTEQGTAGPERQMSKVLFPEVNPVCELLDFWT